MNGDAERYREAAKRLSQAVAEWYAVATWRTRDLTNVLEELERKNRLVLKLTAQLDKLMAVRR